MNFHRSSALGSASAEMARPNAPTAIGPIEEALHSLNSSIAALHEETETLISRLEPVLRNEPHPGTAVEKDRLNSSIPIADRLHALTARVSHLRECVSIANGRLGL